MKRIYFTLLLLALLPALALAGPVDVARAQRAAKTFFDNNGVNATRLTDLSAEAGFTNLYIFNAEKGFVVMAADDCVQPILGYSLTGTFVADGMPDNVRGWLQGYDEEIQAAIDSHAKATPEAARQWFDLENGVKGTRATAVVGPLLSTKWDQGSPYNMYCPSGTVTGCVATAMAQVMKYWNYPEHGIGSYAYIPKTHSEYGQQYANFNETCYDWSHMTDTYNSSSSTQAKQAVATLMYHCGVSVSMNYGPTSGTSTSFVADALKSYFNYSPEAEYRSREGYSDSDWIAMLKADLDLGRPIQYSGNGEGAGHSFVCDGYNDADYFHFNWGWGGYCDEYYTVNNLNPGPGGIGSGANGIYNDYQGAVFGAHPNQCAANAPSNLTFTLSNRELTLSWSPAEGAASYNVYRDNDYIGNVTTTTYTETAPFGTSVYYVRSVDANESLSLSSNGISVTIDYELPVVIDLEANLVNNNVSLSWTAPEWCFPQTESAILTYGDGSTGQFLGYQGNAHMYWGHRYLPSDLEGASDMVIFRVSCYIREVGAYEIQIYEGTTTINYTNASYDVPTTLLKNKSFVASHTGWIDIDLEEPVVIDNSQDLWVMLYDPELKRMPAEYSVYTGHDRGGYYSTSITSWTQTYPQAAFLIRSYLTDGVYTYNLYRDGASIASPLTETSFVDNDLPLGQHSYYVTTNYYAGESEASNTVSFELAQRLVTLNEGWNWWASDVVTSVAELEAVLNEPYQILSQNGPSTGDLVAGQLYKIQTPETVEFPLTGMVADLSSVEVPIGHGINWFGYPGTTSMAITDLVIVPALGDKIISQNGGFAIYGSTGWSGTLNALKPRQGYVYVSTSQEAKTLRFLTDMP